MLLNVTLDAALLSANLQHVTFGMCAVAGMKDPKTGLPIVDLQSTKKQWPFGMGFGKESTEMYSDLIGPKFLDFFSGEVVCPAIVDDDGVVLSPN